MHRRAEGRRCPPDSSGRQGNLHTSLAVLVGAMVVRTVVGRAVVERAVGLVEEERAEVAWVEEERADLMAVDCAMVV